MQPTIELAVTYEPDDQSPVALTVGVALQGVLLGLAPTVLTMSLFAGASGMNEDQIVWSVLVAVLVSGIVTIVQATRFGVLGSGHAVITGTATSYVAVALIAVHEAGLETLATLIVVSACFQFSLARLLPRLRRIITPVVSGVVLMLIAVGVMQVAVERLEQPVAEGTLAAAEPIVAAVTLAVAAMLGLGARGVLRLWSPLVGILAGCAAAGLFGLYDTGRVEDAPWLAVPDPQLPGIDLTPGAQFWALLPMFLIVSMAATLKYIGDSVAVQRVSSRAARATDYRLVQGTVATNGVGSLVGGIVGTLPVGAYGSTTVSLVNFTGVASRMLGYTIGTMLVILALLPKAMALLLTIPDPVTSAYMLIFMGMIFVEGARSVFGDTLQPRKALIVGTSLAVGVGLQGDNIVADLIGAPWGTLLGNGLTMGTITAILLTAFVEVSSPRRRRLECDLGIDAFPRIDEFLAGLATSVGWNEVSVERLRLVGEEAVASLIDANDHDAQPRLIVMARPGAHVVELEFLVVLGEGNLEDQLAYLGEHTDTPEQSEVSLRLLRHFASSVRHRKYSGIDVVAVEVERSG